ncbi:MAG: helix-turn-helix transcriptional regulator [Acidobacteriota bacterium]
MRRKTETHEEQEAIGERLTRIRRERGITQVELARKLGVAQPVLSDYERGELRLHGQLIVKLARILGVTTDELLGVEPSRPSKSPVKNRRLLRRLQDMDMLPKRDQQAIYRTITAFLERAQ